MKLPILIKAAFIFGFAFIICSYKAPVTSRNKSYNPLDTSVKKREVYPNPSSGTFKFKAEEEIETLRVVNLNGKELLRFQNIQKDEVIEFGDKFEPGTYYLHIEKEGELEAIKIIKI